MIRVKVGQEQELYLRGRGHVPRVHGQEVTHDGAVRRGRHRGLKTVDAKFLAINRKNKIKKVTSIKLFLAEKKPVMDEGGQWDMH